MLLFKIIYLAIVVGAVAFFVFYSDIISLLFLFLVLAIPVLLFITVLIMRLSLKITCECKTDIVSNGEKAKVILKISNRFVFPITQIKVYARCKNCFFKTPDKLELSFFASPLSKNEHEISFDSKHAGNVEIVLQKAKVFDYFGLFSFPIKLNKTYTAAYLPKAHQLDVAIRNNIYTLSESDVFSKDKPGDDPSEVFAIRDYAPGDKPNRIHWKLSSKQENVLVKDYSLPISESVLIMPELVVRGDSEKDLDLIDAVLECSVSLSQSFIEKGIMHTFCWYNTSGKFYCRQKIESQEDLYSALGLIFSSTNYYSEPFLSSASMDYYQNISNAIYITPNITEEQCHHLSVSKNPNALCSVINIVDEDVADSITSADDMEIITVHVNSVVESLNETII